MPLLAKVNKCNSANKTVSSNTIIKSIKNLTNCKKIENWAMCKNWGLGKINKKLIKFWKTKSIVKNIKILKNFSFLTFNTRLAFTWLRQVFTKALIFQHFNL